MLTIFRPSLTWILTFCNESWKIDQMPELVFKASMTSNSIEILAFIETYQSINAILKKFQIRGKDVFSQAISPLDTNWAISMKLVDIIHTVVWIIFAFTVGKQKAEHCGHYSLFERLLYLLWNPGYELKIKTLLKSLHSWKNAYRNHSNLHAKVREAI